MIHVDRRTGSKQFEALLKPYGIPVELTTLASADVAFSGNGPSGEVPIGIELKQVYEVTSSHDLRRFLADQLPKMVAEYQFRILMIQGLFREATDGTIEKAVFFGQRLNWFRTKSTMTFNRLARTLYTLQFRLGFQVIQTLDEAHSAREIVRVYRWFQDGWDDHSSYKVTSTSEHPEDRARMLRDPWFDRDKHVSALMLQQIQGIGPKTAEAARRHFRSARRMSWAPASEWEKVPGIGKVLARHVVNAWRRE